MGRTLALATNESPQHRSDAIGKNTQSSNAFGRRKSQGFDHLECRLGLARLGASHDEARRLVARKNTVCAFGKIPHRGRGRPAKLVLEIRVPAGESASEVFDSSEGLESDAVRVEALVREAGERLVAGHAISPNRGRRSPFTLQRVIGARSEEQPAPATHSRSPDALAIRPSAEPARNRR
jgi:hypothetical protein